jgi:hypothetical protein
LIALLGRRPGVRQALIFPASVSSSAATRRRIPWTERAAQKCHRRSTYGRRAETCKKGPASEELDGHFGAGDEVCRPAGAAAARPIPAPRDRRDP